MGNFVLIVKFNSLLYFKPVSLFPTFKPSRRVSCALLPWSEGAVKKVIYAPEILLACIQLATTTDTGGDDFIATGDGDKTLARWKQACDFRQNCRIQLFTHTTELGSQWHLCLCKWRRKSPLMQC